jgi:uncharacterized iron-regulated protein
VEIQDKKQTKLRPVVANSRWVRIRKDLYQRVRSQVYNYLGEEEVSLRKYRKVYEDDFKARFEASSRDQLLKEIKRKKVVLMGDFHALRQSHKSHLRILKSIGNPSSLVVAVECIFNENQDVLNQFLKGNLSEKDFLKKVEWKKNWGFPWDWYKPLFRWAIKNKVQVIGLNSKIFSKKDNLVKRDEFAAKILEVLENNKRYSQVFVIYGDMHLAKKHIPYQLSKRGILKNKQLVIFQNPDEIYFKLLSNEKDLSVDIVRLDNNTFCLSNVPPWVKWQNYLLYLEKNHDSNFKDDVDPTDYVGSYFDIISDELGIQGNRNAFSIETASNSSLWSRLSVKLGKSNLSLIESFIKQGRSIYIPSLQMGFLAQMSVNHAAGLAMNILYQQFSSSKQLVLLESADFYKLIWLETINYFGSKMINPKRKSDTLLDLKLAMSARAPHDSGKSAMQLALRQKLSELMLMSGSKSKQAKYVPQKKTDYIEAARLLGGMLGEKLYYAYRNHILSTSNLKTLLSKKIEMYKSSSIYMELVELIESFPSSFDSKIEKL